MWGGGGVCSPLPSLAGFVKIFAKATVQFYRARICKRLRSPGIDSKKSIPPAYPVEDCFTLFILIFPIWNMPICGKDIFLSVGPLLLPRRSAR
jgi:hypothetical protein